MALDTPDIALIQGPPGTGKTTVIRAIVERLDELSSSAVTGAGAFLNGTPINATAKSELATALIGTGFSYDSERRRRQAEVLAAVLPEIRDIRRIVAAPPDLCAFPCGRRDW